MWKVEPTDECQQRFKQDFKKGLFSRDDGVVLTLWTNEMQAHGPYFIQRSPNWNDHPLEREWAGYRASCFSLSGRIIYRIIEDRIEVSVVRISPDHDYSKK
jgi:mRNA-degrading endonuclease YafQ of YafQ-DinJ toxin-antitoxin module